MTDRPMTLCPECTALPFGTCQSPGMCRVLSKGNDMTTPTGKVRAGLEAHEAGFGSVPDASARRSKRKGAGITPRPWRVR